MEVVGLFGRKVTLRLLEVEMRLDWFVESVAYELTFPFKKPQRAVNFALRV
jgi:hypothetical protein